MSRSKVKFFTIVGDGNAELTNNEPSNFSPLGSEEQQAGFSSLKPYYRQNFLVGSEGLAPLNSLVELKVEEWR